jgi:hypothetical protein
LTGTQLTVEATRAERPEVETYLWYPLLEAAVDRSVELSAINLSTQAADLLVQVFHPDGSLVIDPVQMNLPGEGSYRRSFTNLPMGSAWAVATLSGPEAPKATGAIVARSNDGSELYGLSAEGRRSNSLQVPHIASDTSVFFTRGSVVNLDNQTRASSVEADLSFPIGEQVSGGQAFFSFEDVLGAAIADLTWTRIDYSPQASASTVGAEVFGFLDLDRTVGVGLSDVSYNELYFAHIAEDLNSFWTGVVVINLSDSAEEITFEAYNSMSQLIDGGFTQTFAPGEKKTFVVLGEQLDFGENAAWVKVTSPGPITGFELFSNPSGTAGDTFAGLESIGILSKNLVFPHCEEANTDDGLTAVVVINPGDVSAELTFRLVSDQGVEKASRQWDPINPKQKLAIVSFGIFPENEIEYGDIILVESNQEIAGFELFGNLLGTMGALTASPY